MGCGEPYPGRDDRPGFLDLTFHFRVGSVARAMHGRRDKGAPPAARRGVSGSEQRSNAVSTTSNLTQDPGYFTRYKNFALSRSASGVLTLRFHTGGGPHTFDGTPPHDFPPLLEDLPFAPDNPRLLPTRTAASLLRH